MTTPDAGVSGVSGDISFTTGAATARFDPFYNDRGNSGSVNMTTGDAKGLGKGGDINIRVGKSSYKDGGDVLVMAGNASGSSFNGGTLHLSSGAGDDISGEIVIATPSSRPKTSGSSGSINITTGFSHRASSGALHLGTGDG